MLDAGKQSKRKVTITVGRLIAVSAALTSCYSPNTSFWKFGKCRPIGRSAASVSAKSLCRDWRLFIKLQPLKLLSDSGVAMNCDGPFVAKS